MRILPPSRPKRDNADLKSVVEKYKLPKTKASLIFVRSYYLDTMGVKGKGDTNIYDDAAYLYTPDGVESYNANTEPSFVKKNGRSLFTMGLGKYQYHKGKHKSQYRALRPYPEGVILKGTRDGKPSTGSHTNIHKGGSIASYDVVWSEGCLTIPSIQWEDFISRVYDAMTRYNQKIIDVVIVENKPTTQGQLWHDEKGRII